jgi:chromosome partitioning protein
MCEVIAIANQKGGAGKTTTTKNLGRALAKMGKNVLTIDCDPQFSLSTSLGYDNTDEEPFTISDLMDRVIEMKLVGTLDREYILKAVIDEIKVDYDYILLDCNPSLGMLVINALAACDKVIIPVDSNYLASKGLELFLGTIIRIMKRINTNIKIEGILLTKYVSLTNLSKSSLKDIEEAYGEDLNIFNTKIPNSVKVGESDKEGMSIIDYRPDNPASIAYMEFAKEVLHNG